MTKPDEKKKPGDKDEEEKEKEVKEKDKGKEGREGVFDDRFEDKPKKK